MAGDRPARYAKQQTMARIVSGEILSKSRIAAEPIPETMAIALIMSM
jgi:hypothetical protein